MPKFIITMNYTAPAMRGMIAAPSDREAAARAVVEAAGGAMESMYFTTGPTDAIMTVDIAEVADLLAGLMVAGAAGSVTNIQTQRAFGSEEFMAIQKTAGEIRASYAPPAP